MLLFYVILKFTIHTNGYHSVWSKMNKYINNICIWHLAIFTNKQIKNLKYVEYQEKITGIQTARMTKV